jgi:hypothetical protein
MQVNIISDSRECEYNTGNKFAVTHLYLQSNGTNYWLSFKSLSGSDENTKLHLRKG